MKRKNIFFFALYLFIEPLVRYIEHIAVDVAVRVMLSEVCGHQESQFGLGWELGEINIVFYAVDGCIPQS